MIYTAPNTEYFGYLPQLATFDGLACTPTSATNALTCVLTRPAVPGGVHTPLQSYAGWETVRDDLANNYFFTSPDTVPAGTLPAQAVIGLNQYLIDIGRQQHTSLSAIGLSKDSSGNNIAGWGTPAQNGHPAIGPATQYDSIFTEQIVTGEFLRASLLRTDAILAGGFYSTGDSEPAGHAVVITELKWDDKNANGRIDSADGATVKILDPLDPSQNYSPEVGSTIGYGTGATTQQQLDNALDTKVVATGDALFKTGSIVQNDAGALVVSYQQSSLVNNKGEFQNVGGDASNGQTEAVDMTIMLAMAIGTTGLPDSVDRLIEQGMPEGAFIFEADVFGKEQLNGRVYTNESSDYDNLLHFYRIENADGAIRVEGTDKTLLPGDDGYVEAALKLVDQSNLLDLSSRDSKDEEQLQDFEVTVDADLLFAPLVTTSAGDHWFAFDEANSDGRTHIKELAPNTYGVEDTLGGGDLDFNDLVFQVIPTHLGEPPLFF